MSVTPTLLREARDSKNVPYISFLNEYNPSNCFAYGFVEGSDDVAFYDSQAKQIIPSKHNVNVRFYGCGGKERLRELYDSLDWTRFSRKQIAFFIDRDFSEIIEDKNHFYGDNVYETDEYSIENNIVSADVIERLITGATNLCTPDDYKEREKIVRNFETAKEEFQRQLLPVTVCCILWRQSGVEVCFDKIKLKKIFSVEDRRLVMRVQGDSLVELVHSNCEQDFSRFSKEDYDKTTDYILRRDLYRSLTRGKFLMTFFIEFCNSMLHKSKRRGGSQNFNDASVPLIFAPLCQEVKSLKKFFRKTFLKHFDCKKK